MDSQLAQEISRDFQLVLGGRVGEGIWGLYVGDGNDSLKSLPLKRR